MRKSNFLYIIVIFSFLLLLQSFLILQAVNEMSGDARVVNYSGLVRGATQRLVKLELTHHPNDNLMANLEDYLYGLAGYENDSNIAYMEYEPFQASIGDLLVIWDELKETIYQYREGLAASDALLEVSERHFQKADEATHNAEYGSEGKLGSTEILIIAGMAVISVIVIIVVIFLFVLKRSDHRQLALLHEKNQQLEAAILEANEASRAKSQFLSNMSHDIRTPLNGIIGMTAIASGSVHNPSRVKDCLRKIENSSKHLQSLVNDVLDMSRIESGKFVLNMSEIYLPEFMESLVNIVRQQIKAKRQELNVAIFAVAHERIQGDNLRLDQLLVNILSNSVKFTPVGGTIGLFLKELPGAREGFARFEFVCNDNGIGMSQEFLQHIFESFSRERDSRIDKIEGSGLGLSIAKRITDMMGGDINIESEKDKGTKFTITLEFPIGGQPPVPWDAETLKGIRALVADDDENACLSIGQELESLGITAFIKDSPAEALAMLKDGEKIDIAIIDWKLPGMSGLELCKRIRSEISLTLPILVTSAYDWVDIEKEAAAVPVNGFIPKPMFKSALFSKIQETLFSDGKTEDRLLPRASLRLDGVRVLMAEDNELNTEIAVEILSAAGLRLDCAQDGREAVDKFSASEPYTYSVILMDMQMPVMTGCEAAAAIRGLDRPDADVLIIALTANAFEDDIREALDAGMNAHVAKPINFETLKTVIGQYLSAAAKDAAREKPSSLLDALAAYGVNISSGLARFAGNSKAYEKYLIKFLKDESYETLSAAIKEENIAAALPAAHVLKGLSANLSMDALSQSAARLEQALKAEDLNGAAICFQQTKDLYEVLAEEIGAYQ